MNSKSNLKQTFAQLIASFRYTSISSIYPASISSILKGLLIKLNVLLDPSNPNFWSNMTMNYDDGDDDDDKSSTT